MSRTIDERVVEMRFDNKQFESGVKESLTTLEKLKTSLNMDESAKSFEKIDKAANNVSLEGISAGIEALQKRFSTFGIITMRIIENVTDSLMRMASTAINYINGAIISGGLKRAQNIENAHFQLQALLKDEREVQAVMDNAMASVDGTAYAYDEAARAASQFAASGMRAGESMERALRAITGVAAMTNSEYESISTIFTTVAGNGRLMGDQLLQLSSRGLNAAATIADYFREVQGQANITEGAIREMVSKGQISFETFAAAMDWAFGESAFRANETFTGALSNMRSALARIGAEFFSPLIEQNSDLILLINTLRERINDVKKAVTFDAQKSAISGLTKVTNMQTEALEEMFESISKNGSVSSANLQKLSENGVNAAEALTTYINGVTSGSIRSTYATKKALDELTGGLEVSEDQIRQYVEDGIIDINMFTSAMETAYGDQKALSKQFTDSVLDTAKSVSEYLKNLDLTSTMETLYNGVEIVKNVFKDLYSVVKPLGKALRETFGFSMDDILSLSEKIESVTSRMKLSEEGSKNLHDAFKGVLDIVRLLADGFIAILSAILPIEKPVVSLGSNALGLAGAIGRVLSKFAEFIRSSKTISTVYDVLSRGIQIVSLLLAKMISGFTDFIDTVKNLPVVKSIIDAITSAFDKMGGVFDKAESRFAPFQSILNVFIGAVKKVGPTVISILQGIGNAISFILKSVSEAIGKGGFDGFIDLLNSGLLVGIGVGISKFIERLTTTVSAAGGIFSNINRTIMQFKNILLAFQSQLKAEVLKSIAIAIAILAGSLFVLSMIDSEKLTASIGAMTVLMGELMASLTGFEKIMKDSKTSMSKVATGLIALSASVLILAIALKKVSTIDSDRLLASMVAISILIMEMTAVAIVLSKYGGKIKTGAIGIIAFSAAIYILASSVKKLGELDTSTLTKGLLSVAVLLAELGAFMAAAKFGKFKTSQAVAIIILSSALLVLQKAVEGFGNIDGDVLMKGLIGVAAVLSEIGIFTRLSGDSKHLLSTAASLVVISYALRMLEGPISAFGAMSFTDLGKGLLAIGAALAAVTISLRLMPKNAFSIGVGLLAVAGALTVIGKSVMNLSGMSWEEVGKGMVALGGAMTILAVALNLMKGTLGASSSMLVMAASLAIFVPILKALGNMEISSIVKALIALGGAFTVVGVAGALLAPIIPSILALSAAMLLLGIACTAVGVGVLAFSVGLTTLAASGVAAAAALVEVLKILIVGILNTIRDSAKSFADAIKTIVLVICDVLVSCVPTIVTTSLIILKEVLKGLEENAPDIVNSLLRFVIGVIDALGANLPTLIQSVVNLLMQFFSGIIDALNGIDTGVLLKGIAGIGLIAALMVALSAMTSLAPAAMVGVLAMAAVIAELAIVLAAIGALAQIPGLNWLIGEGGNLLQGVGTAIGKFVGGIAGGFASGVSSQFPQIGSDLSSFMKNVQPFIDGASRINPSTMQGVQSLATTILLLTAGDILQGLTSWLTGGANLATFGEELASFGPPFARFADTIKGVDASVVTGAANAAMVLAEMASTLPNSGGLSGKIFGENNLSDFGRELEAFGPYLARYGASVKGVDPEVVEASARAALVLANMAATLPDSGGLAGKIFGDNSLSNFGEELAKFGPYISEYASSVAGLDADVVVSSANAALALSELANGLPNSGGLISFFTGDNDISTFGESLTKFGNSMSSYYNSVSGINTALLAGVVQEIKKLIEIAKGTASLDTSGMSGFAKALQTMGSNGINSLIQSFNGSVSKVNTAGQNVIQAIADGMNAKMPLLPTTSKNICDAIISAFKTSLQASIFNSIGQNIVVALSTGMSNKRGAVEQSAIGIANATIQAFKGSLSMSVFKEIGENVAIGLANGIKSKLNEAKTAAVSAAKEIVNATKATLDVHSPSRVLERIGEFVSIGLANGILSRISTIGRASEEASETSIDVMSSLIKSISDILDDDEDFEPKIRPVMDLSRIEEGFDQIASMFNEQYRLASYQNVMAASEGFARRSNSGKRSTEKTDSESSGPNIYQLTQNNYSPKALSRAEIYRQTKNLFSTWKGAIETV